MRLIGRAGAPDPHTLFRPVASVLGRPPAPRNGGSSVVRQAYFGPPWGLVETPVLAREYLTRATDGPLLIDEFDSTIVVPPFARAQLDEVGALVLEIENA